MSTPVSISDGHGGSITILEEGSATTPMRFRMVLPSGMSPPPECHPHQTEEFRILSGVFGLGSVNGQLVELVAGQTFTLPAGTFHRPQNNHAEPTELESTLTPGLDSARMFRALYGTVATQRGLGLALRMALIFDRHRREVDFPAAVRIPLRILARLARALGLRVDQETEQHRKTAVLPPA